MRLLSDMSDKNAPTKWAPSFDPSLFQIQGTMNFQNPEVGQKATMSHTFTQKDVHNFSNLTGDSNPIHNNPEFAKNTMFGNTIVHGIYASSLFGSIFGKGRFGSVYVSQTLNFKKPIYVGKPVTAVVEVQLKEPKRKGFLLTLISQITLEDGSIAVDGISKILIPPSDQ